MIDIGYTLTESGNKKQQINLVLKDLRYKILIDAINDGCRATFILWECECTQLLEVTAAQMRTTMLE
ncbi:hypothetical protein RYX36_019215, partial [Vicia faba]